MLTGLRPPGQASATAPWRISWRFGFASLLLIAAATSAGCRGDGARRRREYRAERPIYEAPPARAVPARALTIGGYAGFNYPERRAAQTPPVMFGD